MSKPKITASMLLKVLAQKENGTGRAPLLAAKVKSKLAHYILADTLEKIEALQKMPQQWTATKHNELHTDLELVLQKYPDLVVELQQLLHKEAHHDASIGQVIQGNSTHHAHDQATVVAGPVTGDVNIHHDHTQHNEGNTSIQINNSRAGRDINVNKSK